MEYVPAEGIDGAHDHDESHGARSILRRPWPNETVRYKVMDPFMVAEDAAYTTHVDRSPSEQWDPKGSSDNQPNTFASLGLRCAGSAARGTLTLGRQKNIVRAAAQRKVAISQAIVAGLALLSATLTFSLLRQHHARHRSSHRFFQDATAVAVANAAVPSIAALEVALRAAITAEKFMRAHELKTAIAAANNAEADRKAAMKVAKVACAQACVADYVTLNRFTPASTSTNTTTADIALGHKLEGSGAVSWLWTGFLTGTAQLTCQALCFIDLHGAFAIFDVFDGTAKAMQASEAAPSLSFTVIGRNAGTDQGLGDLEFAPKASASFSISVLWTKLSQASVWCVGNFDGVAALAHTMGWVIFLTLTGWFGLVLLLVAVLVVLGMLHTVGVAVRKAGAATVANVTSAVARSGKPIDEKSRSEAVAASVDNDYLNTDISKHVPIHSASQEVDGGMTPEDFLAFLGYGAEWLGNAAQAWLGHTLLAVLMAFVRRSGLDAALHLESLTRHRHSSSHSNDTHGSSGSSSHNDQHHQHHHHHHHHNDNEDDVAVDVDDCATTALRLQGADHRGIADGGKRITMLAASCNLGGIAPAAGSLSTWFPETPANTDIVAIGICEEPYLGDLYSKSEIDGSDYVSESNNSSSSSSSSASNKRSKRNGTSDTHERKDGIGMMLAVHLGDKFIRVAECRAPHARYVQLTS